MKQKEIQVVNELRTDSRQPLTELAIRTGMPLSTAFDVLKKIEKEKIVRHVCLLDFARLGFSLTLGVFLKVKQRKEAQDFLLSHPSLNSLLRLSGDYDLYAELLFRNMAACQDFCDQLGEIESVRDNSIYFIVDIKQQEFKIQPEKDLQIQPVWSSKQGSL